MQILLFAPVVSILRPFLTVYWLSIRLRRINVLA